MNAKQDHPNRSVTNCAVAENNVKVDLFHTFDDLKSIAQEWDDFVESVGSEIFLTYDWCRIWWNYYGRKRHLHIFVFRYKGKIVGLIPMFCENIWLGPIFVKVLKIVGSDFAFRQFSLPIKKEFIKPVIICFYQLISKSRCDIIHFGPIAGLYDNYDNIKTICEEIFGDTHFVKSRDKGVQTYFTLADNWDDQLASLAKRERGDVRRNYRYICKSIGDPSALVESKFAEAQDLEEIFNEFVTMHESHWNKLGKAGHFVDWPRSKELNYEVAKTQLDHGRLRLLKVSIKKHVLGYGYDYKFGDTYYGLLNTRSDAEEFRNISLGKIVFSEQVKEAIVGRVRCIDAMRGKYDYKLRMGGKLYPIKSLYITPKRLFPKFRVSSFRLLAYFLHFCYYKVWFCRIAPRLPMKPRSLWSLWIRIFAFA
ncbi:MAG: GNAT family N-acetyltransferase [Planctomycetota bacterium]|jgi:CelD/BcsL family acetyltransferase involved in cellulose biosynthesis